MTKIDFVAVLKQSIILCIDHSQLSVLLLTFSTEMMNTYIAIDSQIENTTLVRKHCLLMNLRMRPMTNIILGLNLAGFVDMVLQ